MRACVALITMGQETQRTWVDGPPYISLQPPEVNVFKCREVNAVVIELIPRRLLCEFRHGYGFNQSL